MTLVGETEDSLIYLEKLDAPMQGNNRWSWDGEDLKKPKAAGVASTRTRREYDCKQKRYRVLSSWHAFAGDVIRTPAPTKAWVPTTPGTVGELLFRKVCGA